MYIDSHTHLYDETLLADERQIQRAIDAGVEKMYMPNCDSSTINAMLAVENKWPENCFAMMGLHPVYVKEDFEAELAVVEGWLAKRKFHAIGEIGLDYYWDLTYKKEQLVAFDKQIEWAKQYQLPIIIHSRESTQDCIERVRLQQEGTLKGIFHCFSGTADEARQIIELGFYLGIGGVITYKKSTLPDIIKEIGVANIVLETDAPYLAPVPYRGKRNESSYIPVIAGKLAEITSLNISEVAAITTRNAQFVFGT